MELTDEELVQARSLAERYPVVTKLLDIVISYDEDISKLYMATLTGAIREICRDIKERTLDLDDPYTKAILKLAETGDKVFNTLQRGKQDTSPEETTERLASKKLEKIKNVAI